MVKADTYNSHEYSYFQEQFRPIRSEVTLYGLNKDSLWA